MATVDAHRGAAGTSHRLHDSRRTCHRAGPRYIGTAAARATTKLLQKDSASRRKPCWLQSAQWAGEDGEMGGGRVGRSWPGRRDLAEKEGSCRVPTPASPLPGHISLLLSRASSPYYRPHVFRSTHPPAPRPLSQGAREWREEAQAWCNPSFLCRVSQVHLIWRLPSPPSSLNLSSFIR